MNPQETAKGENMAAGRAQALTLLHAQVLKNTLDGRFLEALSGCEQALALDPDNADTLHLMGAVHLQAGQNELAVEWASRALRKQPKAEFLSTLGFALSNLGRRDDALKVFDKAVVLRPDDARLWSQLGNANAQLTTNKANTLVWLARFDGAIVTYRQALAIDPAFADARWNLGALQLLTGDLENGWREREARWDIPQRRPDYPNLSAPMWLGGQPLDGKTILIWAEEGFGDTIQFARYLPMLAASGARVVLVVEPPLCPLLATIEGVSTCLPKRPNMELPPFDFHCAITSLPLAFGTRLDGIPHDPYLPRPAADRVQAWEERLGSHDKLRVGLVWSGNPKQGNDRNRSMSLATLSRILDLDATFVSLQKPPRPQDAETLREKPEIIDLTPDLTDFAETAALLSCLDLVITVDTSVAHLAAALGRPTWIMLSYLADWRWLLDREDCPWYPGARLFRQDASRNYTDVVDRVRAELTKLTQSFDAS